VHPGKVKPFEPQYDYHAEKSYNKEFYGSVDYS